MSKTSILFTVLRGPMAVRTQHHFMASVLQINSRSFDLFHVPFIPYIPFIALIPIIPIMPNTLSLLSI